MTLTPLVIVSVVLVCAGAQQRFADYDYQDSFDQQQQYRPQARPKTSHKAATTAAPPPPPVAILKQINTHNEDGSYTYGYEAADGSFKIETKKATGEVSGKYGYVDADGKVRTVEYGADRYGFQPAGDGITVPPPTLVDESVRYGPNGEVLEDEEAPQQIGQRPIQSRQQNVPRPRPSPISSQPAFRAQSDQPNYAPRPRPTQEPAPQTYFEREPYTAPALRPQTSSGPVPSRSFSGPSFNPSSGPVPARIAIPGASFAPASNSVPSRPPTGSSYSSGPVPPRARIPGAAPSAPFPAEAPSAPFAAAPVYENGPFAAPPPRRSHSPRPAQRAAPTNLDSLAQQYALPSNPSSRPTAEFSFSSEDPAYSRTINF